MHSDVHSQTALDARDLTRLRILDQIRAAGSISRIDIASALQTSPATVTAATAELMAAGLIEEVAGTASDGARRGRPRVLLKLNGRAHLVAGLKIARQMISVLILDFEGNEVTRHSETLRNVRMAPEDLVLTIRAAVETTSRNAGLSLSGLSGISVGIAGLVNAEQKFVHWSSSLVGRNVDLGPLLARHLPCPAFIENDANLVAKAEQLFGKGQGLQNFLVVTIEHGVGLGIVLGGKLYRGERGCGAEFGHMKVQLDGALCQCGQRGCLEAYVGDYALIREATSADPGTDPKTVAEILDDARSGEALALAVLDRSGQMFGMGISNLINLFDPQRIILSGPQINFDHLYSEKVMDRIRRGVVHVDASLPDIQVNRWGDLMWAKGAAAYGIELVSILKVKELAADAA